MLNNNNEWFGKVVQIMSTHARYFKDPVSLAQCRTGLTQSPLISTEYANSTSNTLAANLINTLTHAFPEKGCFTLEAMHTTTEHLTGQELEI